MDKEFYLIFGIKRGCVSLREVYKKTLDNGYFKTFFRKSLTDLGGFWDTVRAGKEDFMFGDVYIRKDGTKVYIKDLKNQEIDEITEAVNKGLERTDLNFEQYAEYSSQCNKLMKALNEERTKRGV